MNIHIVLAVIFAGFCLFDGIRGGRDKNETEIQPNGVRFQRILQRKKRFLLFPPGAAIVVGFAMLFYQ